VHLADGVIAQPGRCHDGAGRYADRATVGSGRTKAVCDAEAQRLVARRGRCPANGHHDNHPADLDHHDVPVV